VKKEKVPEKRLRDSQNSIVKKEKVHERGFMIARIPSRKRGLRQQQVVA
jgi:ribosomal protein L35